MKNKIMIIILIIFIGISFFLWQSRIITYNNEEFAFSFKYSADMQERYNESTLISLRSSDNGMDVDVIAGTNTENYNKDISELGEGYVNLLRVFNQNVNYEIISDETIYVSRGKTEARKVSFKVEKDKTVDIETAVLIPQSDREITFIFRTTETGMKKKEKQLNKIIDSIELF